MNLKELRDEYNRVFNLIDSNDKKIKNNELKIKNCYSIKNDIKTSFMNRNIHLLVTILFSLLMLFVKMHHAIWLFYGINLVFVSKEIKNIKLLKKSEYNLSESELNDLYKEIELLKSNNKDLSIELDKISDIINGLSNDTCNNDNVLNYCKNKVLIKK